MTDLDVYPVTVRGPHATTGSGLITFARLFTHEGRLYIAEGRNRGGVVNVVTEYPVPEGELEPNPRRSKAASWGEWSWNGCGCSSAWGKHPASKLAAMATPLEKPAAPAGVIPDELDALADTSVDRIDPEIANAQVSTAIDEDTPTPIADAG